MRHLIWAGLLASAFALAESPEPQHFGADFTVEQVISAESLFQDLASYDGQTLRVRGRVADVCQKMGCWMVITHDTSEGSRTLRVRMKDHAFSVAKDCTGSIAQVEGVVTSKQVDPDEAAHFASESASPDKMPENGATKVYEITATSVRIEG